MKPLIVANWKCNPTNSKEAKQLFKSIKSNKDADIVICPPFVYLSLMKGDFGAQNCFYQEGAYTGEVSPAMLKDLGCKYVIIGHSERRKYFNEADMINMKVKAVLNNGLIPILCIGETQEQRDNGQTESVLREQLTSDLNNVSSLDIIIAYEPIWAIGTGNACSVGDAKKAYLFIKGIIDVPILYGGSATSQNSKGYIKEAGFQGLLVGGASLKADEFNNIIKEVI